MTSTGAKQSGWIGTAVNEPLGRHLTALDSAITANTTLARDAAKGTEAAVHLATLRAEAQIAAQRMDDIARTKPRQSPTIGMPW